MVSIIVPAHNEGAVIASLLEGLATPDPGVDREIIVVCNGCTDDTPRVARSVSPLVRVEELPVASKSAAMARGDELVTGYPRVYVDGDVELSWHDIQTLVEPILDGRALATAPTRALSLSSSARLVRWYYDVWLRLPQVQTGLFGRGVIAVGQEGHNRIAGLSLMMSDDLVISEAFAEGERLIVEDSVVVVHPPRTVADLLRRRQRVAIGTTDVDRAGLRSSAARTSVRSLLVMLRDDSALAPKILVFLAVTLVSRGMAHRRRRLGLGDVWLRDESSRQRGSSGIGRKSGDSAE